MKDRYINPFTDFGFKRLFGSEPNKDLLLDRDLKNVIDTGQEEASLERTKEIARRMKAGGEPVAKIVTYTGLTAEQIAQL